MVIKLFRGTKSPKTAKKAIPSPPGAAPQVNLWEFPVMEKLSKPKSQKFNKLINKAKLQYVLMGQIPIDTMNELTDFLKCENCKHFGDCGVIMGKRFSACKKPGAKGKLQYIIIHDASEGETVGIPFCSGFEEVDKNE